jgi:CRISPR-associated protein Csm2
MDIVNIFKDDPSGSELVTFARQTAKTLVGNNLTRAQIRNIFTEVRKIETMWEGPKQAEALRRLNMLKPKLDYQTARSESVKLLRDVLSVAIDQVNQAADSDERNRRFQRFMDLFEAILAYHRSEGGRN